MQRRGFTLIEMMVVVAIFSIVTAAIFMTMASGRQSWQTNEASVQVQEEVRKGLRMLGQELRESGREQATSHVLINGTNDALVFQIPIDANAATAAFDLDANGDIVWGAEAVAGHAIRYDLQAGQLVRQQVDALALDAAPVGAAKIVANHMTVVSFTQAPAAGNITGVDVSLTAQKISLAQHALSASEQLHITLRNVFE